MTVQNLQLTALLTPVAGDRRGGRDLESTLELYALDSAAKEPDEPGIKGIAAVDTRNWSLIAKQAEQLLQQSKDFRAAVHLARALLHSQGLIGYCASIGLIRGLLESYWDDAYPALEDDGQDADVRLNALRELWNPRLLSQLRLTTVIASRELGVFTVNDLLVAKAAPGARANTSAPPVQHADRALATAAPAELAALRTAVRTACADLRWAVAFVAQKVGGHRPFHPAPLASAEGERPAGILDGLSQILGELEPAASAVASPSGEATASEASSVATETNMTLSSIPPPRPAASMQVVGEPQTREDVVQLLDQVCRYYARHEPSSPVPLLIERAKRVAHMSFLDIVRDLADKGLPQIEAWAGKEPKA
ncbi:MAG: hypothetical protein JWN48_4296 [Myxococcaceae bacterium]|nr:hypothetical protein [Myxococcaceae bacterium]